MPVYQTCIFCQRNDSPRSTEHILPTWIANEFPEVLEWRITDDRQNRSYGATGHLGITSNAACERCNTGWMHDLEDLAKPILVPMMHGQTTRLTAADQLIVARWFFKTVIMLEQTGRPVFFTDEDRLAFFQSFKIPHTLMFLARYIGQFPIITQDWKLELIFGDRNAPLESDGYTSTLIIKQLGLQVFIARRPKDADFGRATFRLPQSFSLAELRLWPVRTALTWPPPLAFDDSGLKVYIERWGTAAL